MIASHFIREQLYNKDNNNILTSASRPLKNVRFLQSCPASFSDNISIISLYMYNSSTIPLINSIVGMPEWLENEVKPELNFRQLFLKTNKYSQFRRRSSVSTSLLFKLF